MLDKLIAKLLGTGFVSKRLIVAIASIVASVLVVKAESIGVTLDKTEIITALTTIGLNGLGYIAGETHRPSADKKVK